MFTLSKAADCNNNFKGFEAGATESLAVSVFRVCEAFESGVKSTSTKASLNSNVFMLKSEFGRSSLPILELNSLKTIFARVAEFSSSYNTSKSWRFKLLIPIFKGLFCESESTVSSRFSATSCNIPWLKVSFNPLASI